MKPRLYKNPEKEYIIINVQTSINLSTMNPMIGDFRQSFIGLISLLLHNYTKASPCPNLANQLEQNQKRIRINTSISVSSVNAILASPRPKILLSPYTYTASPAIVPKQP